MRPRRAVPGRPFFLWLHYIDPHPPYSRAGATRHKSFRSDSLLGAGKPAAVPFTLTSPDVARLRSGELRLSGSTRQLQYRTWDPGTQPISPTAWRPLADAVQPGSAAVSAAQPFTLLPADATNNQQRLRVSLASTAGGAGAALRRDASVTYGALNSDPSKATDTVCTAGRSLP